jgi:signal transduction histidine kinase
MRAGPGEGEASLSVADNGGGIEAKILDRVFEPFFTTKQVGEGTGLGLAIVRTIVQKHHGRVELHNHPGEGATFTVVLPSAAPTPPVTDPGNATVARET